MTDYTICKQTYVVQSALIVAINKNLGMNVHYWGLIEKHGEVHHPVHHRSSPPWFNANPNYNTNSNLNPNPNPNPTACPN